MAITIIENKDFVEGIFFCFKDAENYLMDHPQKDNCLLKELMINEYPLYIAEANYGEFHYFSKKSEIFDYIKNLDIKNINEKITTAFYIDEENNTEDEGFNEKSITIYVINDSYINEKKNEDTMGMFKHYHIEEKAIMEIKNGSSNYESLL